MNAEERIAKDTDRYDEMKFTFRNKAGELFEARFLDAYYGMFIVPVISEDTFVTYSQIKDIIDKESFEPVDE
jgi:hypothetical protein